MTKNTKTQRDAALESILNSLQQEDAVDLRNINEQLDMLYQAYTANNSSASYTEESMTTWKKFQVIDAKLDALKIRSYAFDQLKDHLFPAD